MNATQSDIAIKLQKQFNLKANKMNGIKGWSIKTTTWQAVKELFNYPENDNNDGFEFGFGCGQSVGQIVQGRNIPVKPDSL